MVAGVELPVERQQQRAPHAHFGKWRKLPLVQRHMLVGVPARLVDDDRLQAGDLAVLVPRHRRDHVHFAAFQLVDPRVGVRDELEHQPADPRVLVAAPVVRHPLEQDVFPGSPLGDAVGSGAERTAVVVLRAIDVTALEPVPGQEAADELDVVRRVDLPVMDDRRQRIRRVDRADAVEAVGALGVVVRPLIASTVNFTRRCHRCAVGHVTLRAARTSMPPSGGTRTRRRSVGRPWREANHLNASPS